MVFETATFKRRGKRGGKNLFLRDGEAKDWLEAGCVAGGVKAGARIGEVEIGGGVREGLRIDAGCCEPKVRWPAPDDTCGGGNRAVPLAMATGDESP